MEENTDDVHDIAVFIKAAFGHTGITDLSVINSLMWTSSDPMCQQRVKSRSVMSVMVKHEDFLPLKAAENKKSKQRKSQFPESKTSKYRVLHSRDDTVEIIIIHGAM